MPMVNGLLEPGNVLVSAPYYISGKSGTLTDRAAGDVIACLQNIGRIDPNIVGVLPVPLRLSQVRMKYLPVTTPATVGVGFEVYKGVVTSQYTAGGTQKLAVRRKTTGYPAITAAEVNLYVATTTVISTGTFVAEGDPFDMMTQGASTALSGGESIWKPADMVPLSIEAGEGCEVRVTEHSGTGIFLVVFDFLRQ